MVSLARRERRRERAGRAAVLLITSILMTWSGAGAVCVGREVAMDRGEAVVRCPLTADANQIEHGIIVKHFSNSTSYPEAVLTCYWTGPNKYDCRSDFDFKLMEPVTDLVMAKVPKEKLQKDGSYKCQLYPPDFDQPFTPCETFPAETTTERPVGPSPPDDLREPVPGASEKPLTDNPKDPPTTEKPVDPSPQVAVLGSVPGASEKPLTCSDGVPENGSHLEGLVVAVVGLAFTVIILLLLDIGVILYYVHTRGTVKPPREAKKLMNGTC